MTFIIKTRGAASPFAMAEYICPVHGRFEMLVDRDEKGDPPDRIRCMAMLDVDITDADRDPEEPSMCDEWAEYTISAPMPMKDSVPCTAVVRGGDMKDRPPGMLDTRPLAEGMPMSEWKKVQKKHTEERRHQELIKKGLKTKKVQVG